MSDDKDVHCRCIVCDTVIDFNICQDILWCDAEAIDIPLYRNGYVHYSCISYDFYVCIYTDAGKTLQCKLGEKMVSLLKKDIGLDIQDYIYELMEIWECAGKTGTHDLLKLERMISGNEDSLKKRQFNLLWEAAKKKNTTLYVATTENAKTYHVYIYKNVESNLHFADIW